MQTGQANGQTQLAYSRWPRLPFTLACAEISADPIPLALVTRLDALQRLAIETRDQLELLRRESARVAHALTPPRPPLEPKPSRTQPLITAPKRPALADEGACMRMFLLGTFQLQANGRVVTRWPSRKSRMLLAYLAAERNRLVPKDVLIELFWPDFSLARGSNNLSIAIHQIRTTLKELVPGGDRVVRVDQGLYGLNQTLVSWVDLHEFRQHLSAARLALQRGDKSAARQYFLAAVDLYRGDFLESDPYDEWTLEPRRSSAAAFARALAWLAGDAAASNDWEGVLDYAGEIVRRDPCDEEGHRWLITAYWQLGKPARALQQYQLCSERLAEDLGASPSEETWRLCSEFRG